MNEPYYESERAAAEYLLFHYGAPEEVLPYAFGPADSLHYPVRCVTECLDPDRVPPSARALDLGCSVGRATFELARHAVEVIGIDFSRRFVAVARELARLGAVDYSLVEEGVRTRPAVARVPSGIDRARAAFEWGDAERLRKDLGAFDVILMANLVDRLRDPRRCLEQLPRLARSGGQLIITSPYTWLEDYTPHEQWLGGVVRNGRNVTTLEGLREALEPHFRLERARDMPFLIREHARKYQWSVAEASVWIRA